MDGAIKFTRNRQNLIISIPIKTLKIVADDHPELQDEQIFNKSILADDVLYELQHNLGANESGLTGFQELIDEAILAAYEGGSEAWSEPE